MLNFIKPSWSDELTYDEIGAIIDNFSGAGWYQHQKDTAYVEEIAPGFFNVDVWHGARIGEIKAGLQRMIESHENRAH